MDKSSLKSYLRHSGSLVQSIRDIPELSFSFECGWSETVRDDTNIDHKQERFIPATYIPMQIMMTASKYLSQGGSNTDFLRIISIHQRTRTFHILKALKDD